MLGFLSEPIALWEASSDLLRLSLFLFVCLFVFSDFLWHSLIAIVTSYYNYFSVYFPYWIVDKQQGLRGGSWNAGDGGLILDSSRPPKKDMTTHSSILVWWIPWAEELGRLWSVGSQRVGHDWATSIFTVQTWRLFGSPLNRLLSAEWLAFDRYSVNIWWMKVKRQAQRHQLLYCQYERFWWDGY